LFFTFNYLCLGIGAGLESMTTNPMAWDGSVNPRVIFPFFLTLTPLPDYLIHSIFYFWFLEIIPLKGYKVVICPTLYSQVKMFEQAQNCLLPMGITSENDVGTSTEKASPTITSIIIFSLSIDTKKTSKERKKKKTRTKEFTRIRVLLFYLGFLET
jgi:hypothetical protein